MADYKKMNLEQLQAAKKSLQASGKTLSTSKELGKVEDLIKTLSPEKYGKETVSSAYSKLSSGVTERGGWTEANAEKIYEYTGKYPNLEPPKDASQLSGYLNDYQDGVFNFSNSPETREGFVNSLTPNTDQPETFSRVEQFENLREQYGVADLETNLTSLKAEQEALIAEGRTRKFDEEGKPVPLNVISGRVSEIERQTNERLDVINRTINTVVDQLQTSYGVIETYINLQGLDYQDAVQAYDREFNQNLQIYKLIDEEMDEQQANARANLQLYANAIIAGNIDYGKLSSDQKAFLSKLEVQSGLPIGFTSSLKADNAGGKVLSTSTRESGGQKYADVVMQMPDGSMKVVSQSLGAVSGSGGAKQTESEYLRTASRDMVTLLSSKSGKDGYVSPTTWSTASKAWVAETGQKQEEFALAFGSYVNPKYGDEYLGYEKAFQNY